MSSLNLKQQRFVEEYLIDLNATQAAIRAGYSERTARSQASDLLTKHDIQAAVAAANQDRSRRTLITADGVLKRLDRLAETAEAAGDFTAAIRANQLLGQHYKLFTEKHEHGGIGGPAIVLHVTEAEADH